VRCARGPVRGPQRALEPVLERWDAETPAGVAERAPARASIKVPRFRSATKSSYLPTRGDPRAASSHSTLSDPSILCPHRIRRRSRDSAVRRARTRHPANHRHPSRQRRARRRVEGGASLRLTAPASVSVAATPRSGVVLKTEGVVALLPPEEEAGDRPRQGGAVGHRHRADLLPQADLLLRGRRHPAGSGRRPAVAMGRKDPWIPEGADPRHLGGCTGSSRTTRARRTPFPRRGRRCRSNHRDPSRRQEHSYRTIPSP
jgi:hypothetical protein